MQDDVENPVHALHTPVSTRSVPEDDTAGQLAMPRRGVHARVSTFINSLHFDLETTLPKNESAASGEKGAGGRPQGGWTRRLAQRKRRFIPASPHT